MSGMTSTVQPVTELSNWVTKKHEIIWQGATAGATNGIGIVYGGGTTTGYKSYVDPQMVDPMTNLPMLAVVGQQYGFTFYPAVPAGLTPSNIGNILIRFYLESVSSVTIYVILALETAGNQVNYLQFLVPNDQLVYGMNNIIVNPLSTSSTSPTNTGTVWSTHGTYTLTSAINSMAINFWNAADAANIASMRNPIFLSLVGIGGRGTPTIVLFKDEFQSNYNSNFLAFANAMGLNYTSGCDGNQLGSWTASGHGYVWTPASSNAIMQSQYAAGNEVALAGMNHVSYQTNYATLAADVESNFQCWNGANIKQGKFLTFSYPLGAANPTSCEILRSFGVNAAVAGSKVTHALTEFGTPEMQYLSRIGIDNQPYSYLQNSIARVVLFGSMELWLFHEPIPGGTQSTATGNSIQSYENNLEAAIKLALASGCQVLSMSQALAQISPDQQAYHPLPLAAFFSINNTPIPVFTNKTLNRIRGNVVANSTIQTPIVEKLPVGSSISFTFYRPPLGSATTTISWPSNFVDGTGLALSTANNNWVDAIPTTNDSMSTNIQFRYAGLNAGGTPIFIQTGPKNFWA